MSQYSTGYSINMKRYIKLYKQSKEEVNDQRLNTILEKLDELYYELNDDEIVFLESRGFC